MRTISERDWKVLRTIEPAAVERFCERALADVRKAMSATGATAESRYGAVLGLVRESRAEFDRIFGEVRRSNAFNEIIAIRSVDLMEPDEFTRFTDETRAEIERVEKLLTPGP